MRWALAALLTAAALLPWLIAEPATALPMYAQRSGRTCANCHISPTWEDDDGWDNPELAKRKCSLSCVSCHVDPTGGGLRNTSGRYYGQSTLSMVHTQARGYADQEREIFGDEQLYNVQQWFDQPARNAEGRFVPSSQDEVHAGIGDGQNGRWTAHGRLKKAPAMAFWDGRYADLNADPIVSLGGDMRAAYWSGSDTFFPMQMELHGALHPAHHVMVVGTVAARGHSVGGIDPLPIFPRRAFVMVNELPYMSWAKAGIFLPAFGTYLDDHTAPVRDLFEMDVSDPGDTVLGVEVGTAPNYPFATVSAFANDATMSGSDVGWGMAAQGGYRELWWTVSGHAQIRQRGGEGRGDLMAGGIGWALNPATIWQPVAVTWMGEVSAGQRVVQGEKTAHIATLSEVSWMAANGVIVRYRTDMSQPSLQVRGPVQTRHSIGLGLSPVPGLTLDTWGRALKVRGTPARLDLFVSSHVWF